ncbi:MAG TPA: MFS transporter [Pseudonocardiaceae bacterium]|nr:MFS transporter [Pseudonocardiaceae bacterium]
MLNVETVDRSWLRAGIAVAAVGWGANQFAPLLLLYRARLGLSAATVAATFGLYALGLMPALLVGGLLADRHGRRAVLLPALIASVLAGTLLIAGGNTPGLLFAGRLIAGTASGAAFSSGAAWVKELSPAGTGARRLTVAMTAGFAAGPLVAGMLAQWAPLPTVVPYLPQLALALIAIPLVLRTRETATGQRGIGLRLPALRDPRFRRVVVPLAPWVFGSASIALAYLPGLVSGSLVFAAVTATLTGLAGIAIQPLARRLDPLPLRRIALAVVVLGLLVSALAADLAQPALVVVSALVLGAGYGACLVCGLLEVQRIAGPAELAGLTAIYQAISYLGFAAPFLLAALAPIIAPSLLLLIVAALAALTLFWTATT